MKESVKKNNNGDLNNLDFASPVDSIACFQVESCSVLGSLKRDQHKHLSESSLTVIDLTRLNILHLMKKI